MTRPHTFVGRAFAAWCCVVVVIATFFTAIKVGDTLFGAEDEMLHNYRTCVAAGGSFETPTAVDPRDGFRCVIP